MKDILLFLLTGVISIILIFTIFIVNLYNVVSDFLTVYLFGRWGVGENLRRAFAFYFYNIIAFLCVKLNFIQNLIFVNVPMKLEYILSGALGSIS